MQAAVLASLLAEHPTQLTSLDLYRERKDPDDIAERDAVDRAVQCLVSAGLVHRSGPFVVPSRGALKFEQLSWL
jgi:Fe2+ or Zn2+ uptake regulation protein